MKKTYAKQIKEAEEPVTRIMASAVKSMVHWCERSVDRTNPEYFKSKFDYTTRQDLSQR